MKSVAETLRGVYNVSLAVGELDKHITEVNSRYDFFKVTPAEEKEALDAVITSSQWERVIEAIKTVRNGEKFTSLEEVNSIAEAFTTSIKETTPKELLTMSNRMGTAMFKDLVNHVGYDIAG